MAIFGMVEPYVKAETKACTGLFAVAHLIGGDPSYYAACDGTISCHFN
jgi:hypothetical protein